MRLLRLALIMLGLGALCWGWFALPELQAALAIKNISSRILAGEPFQQEDIEHEVIAFTATRAFVVHSARMQGAGAILKLRVLEMAMDRADPAGLDARMVVLSASLRGALALNPSDALLWTFLYWLESMREGPSESTRTYLKLSYVFSPLEGMVALRRNRFALSNFELFDDLTQDRVVSEFAKMLDASFVDVVTSSLIGPGWNKRDRLLSGFSGVDLAAKQALVKSLALEGIRLEITGTPSVEERPWRK